MEREGGFMEKRRKAARLFREEQKRVGETALYPRRSRRMIHAYNAAFHGRIFYFIWWRCLFFFLLPFFVSYQ